VGVELQNTKPHILAIATGALEMHGLVAWNDLEPQSLQQAGAGTGWTAKGISSRLSKKEMPQPTAQSRCCLEGEVHHSSVASGSH